MQDPRVLDEMLPYLTEHWGNPHSRTHAYGWESEKAMEKARQVMILIYYVANPGELRISRSGVYGILIDFLRSQRVLCTDRC